MIVSLLNSTLLENSICEVKPCSFDGIYQPSLTETFPNGKILLLSYFYDRIYPLLSSSDGDDDDPDRLPPTIASLAALATDVCLGQPSWDERWGKAGNSQALEELKDRPEYCLDLTFMYTLLRLGYEFGDEHTVRIGKRIDGTELGWALGAAIAMVGAEITCKA
jgi:guanosine-diphosphatase